MVDYLPLVLTGLSITASIIYYASVLRNQNKTRQTQLFMQIYQTRNEHENMVRWYELSSWEWEDLDDFRRKYQTDASPEIKVLPAEQFATYDGIGLLVKDRLVDVNTVFQLMSEPIVVMWFKFETVIKGFRRETEVGTNYFENFEYLANEMIKMRKQRGLSLPISTLHPSSTLLEEL